MLIDEDVEMSLAFFGELFDQEEPDISIAFFTEPCAQGIPRRHDGYGVLQGLGECEEANHALIDGERLVSLETETPIPEPVDELIFLLLPAHWAIPPLAWCGNNYPLPGG